MRQQMMVESPFPSVLDTVRGRRVLSSPDELCGHRPDEPNLNNRHSLPTIVFIESNTSGTGRLFIHVARIHRLRPLMICADPKRYPYVAEEALDHIIFDTSDQEGIFVTCRALAEKVPLAGVTSSSEYFIGVAARIAARMGLRGPSAEAIDICRNKYQQRRRLADAGIRIPKYRVVRNSNQATEAATALGLPVVVKPIAGSGSVGVRLCFTFDEIACHVQALADASPSSVTAPPVLVEHFVDAPEFSVETFAGKPVGITCKHLSQPPLFVEIGHDHPATLPPEVHQLIEDAALRTLEALELTWGATHIELRLAPEGPVIIEVNPRLAGGFIPELVRLARGVDLIDATIRCITGQPIDLVPTRWSHASIRFLQPPGAGTLSAVEGVDKALDIAGVHEVALYQRVGQAVSLHGDFRDRIGHVIACGSREHAAAAAERARDVIAITINAG